MKLIALFFPAIISVCIYCKRQSIALECRLNLLVRYMIYIMIISLCSCFSIVYVLKKTPVMAELEIFEFFTKYMLIALIFSCIIPYLEEILKKYISVKFHVEYNSKKDEIIQNK